MTAPNPLLSLSVADLIKEVEATIEGIQTALNLVEKFEVFLPAQYRAPLDELQKTLAVVDGFLKKL